MSDDALDALRRCDADALATLRRTFERAAHQHEWRFNAARRHVAAWTGKTARIAMRDNARAEAYRAVIALLDSLAPERGA